VHHLIGRIVTDLARASLAIDSPARAALSSSGVRRVALLALLFASETRVASAYEFEIESETVGQAYQLRWTRFSERDRILDRRRFTESLGLDVWGILEPSYDAARPDPPPLAPFDLYVTFRMRLLHDFGDYTAGDVAHGAQVDSATSAVPELGREDLELEILWAAVGARGILDRIDVALGRQLVVDSFDWIALDGLTAVARLPGHVAVEALGGFLVRDSSPLGSPTHEPDGTSSSECSVFQDGAFKDATTCEQRRKPAPTWGAALATHGLRWLSARLSYRRTVAATAAGLYPDASGEAPGWGVLEEKVAASARLRLLGGRLFPYAAARWNLVLGGIDEAHAGVRLALGDHAFTPEALYSFPSFDGDSIFNVFAAQPYWDGRLTYDLWPGRGALRLYARGFVRRFVNEDIATIQFAAASKLAAGGAIGGRWRGSGLALRADLSYEDGYGGRRAGGSLSGSWEATRRWSFEGRASLVHFDEDMLDDLHATSFGAQAGARVRLGPGMTLHLLGEDNFNRFDRGLRLLAMLDLAFRPEH
jgi:hypothetical protein